MSNKKIDLSDSWIGAVARYAVTMALTEKKEAESPEAEKTAKRNVPSICSTLLCRPTIA